MDYTRDRDSPTRCIKAFRPFPGISDMANFDAPPRCLKFLKDLAKAVFDTDRLWLYRRLVRA